MKILLVEDDRCTQMIETRFLESRGHSIILAEDGNKALEALQILPDIDAIISDINMPHKNGYELIEAVKSNPQFAEIPFFFASTEERLDPRVNLAITKSDKYYNADDVPLEFIQLETQHASQH